MNVVVVLRPVFGFWTSIPLASTFPVVDLTLFVSTAR